MKLRTNVLMGLGAATVLAALATTDTASAQGRVIVRPRATCAMTFQNGVRFGGDVNGLTPICRMNALRHNAKIADALDKANDDDDDDDDNKADAIAQSIEAQQKAADAAVKAAWKEVVEDRRELAKATPANRKALEDELKEDEEDYNKKLDEAGALAKKISDKAQRQIRASILKEQDDVKKIQEKLKSATGVLKLQLENDLVDEQQDVAEKEELLAKSDLAEALQQFRVGARKIRGVTAAVEARLDQAKEAYEKVENRVNATVAGLKNRANQISADLKKANAKIVNTVKSVKQKAATVKKKFKDLTKDVKGAVAKAKSTVNNVKKTVNDVKDTLDDLGDVFGW